MTPINQIAFTVGIAFFGDSFRLRWWFPRGFKKKGRQGELLFFFVWETSYSPGNVSIVGIYKTKHVGLSSHPRPPARVLAQVLLLGVPNTTQTNHSPPPYVWCFFLDVLVSSVHSIQHAHRHSCWPEAEKKKRSSWHYYYAHPWYKSFELK